MILRLCTLILKQQYTTAGPRNWANPGGEGEDLTAAGLKSPACTPGVDLTVKLLKDETGHGSGNPQPKRLSPEPLDPKQPLVRRNDGDLTRFVRIFARWLCSLHYLRLILIRMLITYQ